MVTRILPLKFIWVVTASHFIAYFIAGLLAAEIFDYQSLFASPQMAAMMRPVSSPVVILGPLLQLVRGVLLGLILLPIYNVIIGERYGILKLGVLIIGLCLLSTIGPTFGSFDGLIYTVIPVRDQLTGYFEAFLYVILFCALIRIPFRYQRKWIHYIYMVFILLVSGLLLVGYFHAIG